MNFSSGLMTIKVEEHKEHTYTKKMERLKKWNLDLTEYVRHQIHHPENHNNTHFTQEELKQSIDDMRTYIRNRAETEGMWEPIP